MQRRHFIGSIIGAAVTLPSLTSEALADHGESSDEFTFVHCTDAHLEPSLNAPEGATRCFEQISSETGICHSGRRPGKHPRQHVDGQCRDLYRLYAQVEKSLKCQVFRVVGNHDVVGFGHQSPVLRNDPLFGKGLYEDEMGKRYYSSTTSIGTSLSSTQLISCHFGAIPALLSKSN